MEEDQPVEVQEVVLREVLGEVTAEVPPEEVLEEVLLEAQVAEAAEVLQEGVLAEVP